MQRIAVVNSKGGVGKSTVVACLGAALRDRGKRVLIVDLDPQASLTFWFAVPDRGTELLAALLHKEFPLLPLIHHLPDGLDFIPSGIALVQFDANTTGRAGRDFLVRNAFAQLPADRWDYIIYDTPGSFGILTLNALAAADFFLVPIEAAPLSTQPLLYVFQIADQVRETVNPGLRCAGMFACRINLRARNPLEILRLARDQFGDDVFDTFIRNNVNIAEAPAHQKDIFRYMSRSNGAEDFRRLAEELETRLEHMTPKHQEVANA